MFADIAACPESLPGLLKAVVCQTWLPLSEGFLPRLCCLGSCLQLQPGPVLPDIATSNTRFLLVLPAERPGAACRAGDPRGEMPVPIPVPPGLKPCTRGIKTQTLGREHHPRPTQGRFSFHCGFFSCIFKLFHRLLVTPGCLQHGCQTLEFL